MAGRRPAELLQLSIVTRQLGTSKKSLNWCLSGWKPEEFWARQGDTFHSPGREPWVWCSNKTGTPPAGGVADSHERSVYVKHWLFEYQRTSTSATHSLRSGFGYYFHFTPGLTPWAIELTAPPVGGAQNSARLRLTKFKFSEFLEVPNLGTSKNSLFHLNCMV